jgi:hypothetical protein
LDNTLASRLKWLSLSKEQPEVMGTGQQRSLILEATESQALLLQQRLSEMGKTVDYQEEQHGPALFIYLRFQREQEKAVRGLLAEMGLRAPEQGRGIDRVSRVACFAKGLAR